MKYALCLLSVITFSLYIKAQNVGIGTALPDATLHVNGTLKLNLTGQASGRVLTSTSAGVATWQPASLALPYNGSILTTGNSFTIINGSTSGAAGYFVTNNAANYEYTLRGINYSTSSGGVGVYGETAGTEDGVEFSGVYGSSIGTGSQAAGVRGRSTNSYGVAGSSQTGIGVSGGAYQSGGYGGFFTGANGATALRSFGPVIISNLGEGNGKVLTSDVNGNASWQPAGLSLPYSGTSGSVQNTFSIVNSGNSNSAGYFETSSTSNTAHTLQGISKSTNGGNGVFGQTFSNTNGLEASGVYGAASGTGNQTAGVRGRHTGAGYGVIGTSASGVGVQGMASQAGGTGGLFRSLGGVALALNVDGPIRLDNIGAGNGKVLTSDFLGNATWQTPAGWSLLGNAGTLSSTNFIGTTDLIPLVFRMNNLRSGIIAENSTALGYQSQESSSTIHNVSIGTRTLRVSTGTQNTAVGFEALLSNSTGINNVAVGTFAMSANTTGSNNVAIGRVALAYSKTISDLVAVGHYAMRVNGQNAVGTQGYYNTAVGTMAMELNDVGTENTAMGYKAMQNNVSGNYNTASGWEALYTNTSGYSNSAFGDEALAFNETGIGNAALGLRALYSNSTGSQNTGVGSYAGNNLPNNVNNVTCVGYFSGRTTALSNQVFLGNTSITHIIAQVTGITAYSDGRIKENVRENVGGLSFINALRPVTYNVNLHKENDLLNINDKSLKGTGTQETADKYNLEKIVQTGFIAQEVEAAAKKAGYNFSGLSIPKNGQGLYGINYTEFVVPLVKAVQEQQVIIDEQNKKIATQQLLLEAMEKRLKALEKN